MEGQPVWLPSHRSEVRMAVRLEVALTGLRVQFSGADLVAACSRGLVLPFNRILGVRVMARADAVALEPRLPCPGLWWSQRYRAGCWGSVNVDSFGAHARAHRWWSSTSPGARSTVSSWTSTSPSGLTDRSMRPCSTARRPALDARSAEPRTVHHQSPRARSRLRRAAPATAAGTGARTSTHPRTRRGAAKAANSRTPQPRERRRQGRQQRAGKARPEPGLAPANPSHTSAAPHTRLNSRAARDRRPQRPRHRALAAERDRPERGRAAARLYEHHARSRAPGTATRLPTFHPLRPELVVITRRRAGRCAASMLSRVTCTGLALGAAALLKLGSRCPDVAARPG